MQIQIIRSQRSTAAVVGISHRAIRLPRRRARKEYLLFKFDFNENK